MFTACAVHSREKRLELSLRPKIPVTSNVKERSENARDIVRKLALDVKHTRDWTCDFCGALSPSQWKTNPRPNYRRPLTDVPARESQHCVASWMHLSPPRMVAYVSAHPQRCAQIAHFLTPSKIFLMCTTSDGPCKDQIDELLTDTSMMQGQLHIPTPVPPLPPGEKFPLAGSCAFCHDEDSATKNLSRCGRCKMTRCVDLRDCRCGSFAGLIGLLLP